MRTAPVRPANDRHAVCWLALKRKSQFVNETWGLEEERPASYSVKPTLEEPSGVTQGENADSTYSTPRKRMEKTYTY